MQHAVQTKGTTTTKSVQLMIKQLKKLLTPNESNRHSWVKEKLSKVKKNSNILDAGCGTQRYRKYCKHLQYFSQDFGQYTGDGTGLQISDWKYGNLDYIGDIWEINETDKKFDVVLCTEVMEHIPYPNETIKEFSRVIKTGGEIILTAPFASLPHMRPYYYYSGFSIEWYEFILKENGFEVLEITPNGDFFSFLLQENLRGLTLTNNVFIKVIYLIATVPTIFLDFLLSKINKNYQLVFGYHVHAKKID